LVTFETSHLASHVATSKSYRFRAEEDGLWWPQTELGKGMLDWFGKVRLGQVSLICNLK